jgi:hypothetical protein
MTGADCHPEQREGSFKTKRFTRLAEPVLSLVATSTSHEHESFRYFSAVYINLIFHVEPEH